MTSETPGRLLRLLALLQARREWAGSELAERLGVTDRTIRRDIGRLRDLGYPVTGTTGTAGGYRLSAGAELPPLLLDDEEAVAVAASLLTAGNVTAIEETAARALAKLQRILPTRLRHRVTVLSEATEPLPTRAWGTAARAGDPTGAATPDHDGPATSGGGGAEVPAGRTGPVEGRGEPVGRAGPRVAPEVLGVLAPAQRDREVVRFAYRDRAGRGSERRVEPYGLVVAEGRWCLVAYDLGREDWRTFRLERMSGVAATGRRFAPRPLPAPDAGTFVLRALASAPYRYRARAVVPGTGAALAGRMPGPVPGTIEARDDGTCVVRLRSDDADLVAAHLVALGPHACIDAGPDLRAHLDRVADRLRAAGR